MVNEIGVVVAVEGEIVIGEGVGGIIVGVNATDGIGGVGLGERGMDFHISDFMRNVGDGCGRFILEKVPQARMARNTGIHVRGRNFEVIL
jgi:hypothetical protein